MDWAHVKHVCSDIVRVLGGWRKASVAAILCGGAPVFMLWLASKRRRPIPITFGELLTALQVKWAPQQQQQQQLQSLELTQY